MARSKGIRMVQNEEDLVDCDECLVYKYLEKGVFKFVCVWGGRFDYFGKKQIEIKKESMN